MITMADRTLEPIDRVHAGELVRSYDVTTGAFVAASVTAVVQHDPEASSAGIVVVNGTLHVTTNHPIWVDGRISAAPSCCSPVRAGRARRPRGAGTSSVRSSSSRVRCRPST
jgi:hypothetical protein